MGISSLLIPKPRLHFHNSGLPKPTRWFSSSSVLSGEAEKPSRLKKAESTKKQRAAAAESYVREYMEIHPGVFPKATQVQKNVGGSWYTIKGILNNLKEVILGNPQLKEQTSCETPDSTVDTKASDVIVQFQGAAMDSFTKEKSISMNEPSHIMEKNASEEMINLAASEVSMIRNNPGNCTLDEAEGTIQLSEAVIDPCKEENNRSTSVPSYIMGKSFSKEMAQSDEMSDNSKVTELDKAHNAERAMSALPVGFDRKQKSEAEHLSCFAQQLLGGTSRTLKKVGADGLSRLRNEFFQIDRRTANSVGRENESSEVHGMPVSSNGGQKVVGLADMFMRTMNHQKTGEEVGEKSNILTHSGFLENSNERSEEDMTNGFHIKGLIDCIKLLRTEATTKSQNNSSTESITKSQDRTISNTTDQVSDRGSLKSIQPQANLQNSEVKSRKTLLKGYDVGKESSKYSKSKADTSTRISSTLHTEYMDKNEKGTDLNVAGYSIVKSETMENFSTEEGTNQNKLLLRFLHHDIENSDIVSAFGDDCGPIVKIEEFSFVEGSNFKDTQVHFKTRKGVNKALQKIDLLVRSKDVVVESTSLEHVSNTISIPSLIGDPDVPVSLVKNPTQTVMIKQLTYDISSQQLIDALSFCGSAISSLFLGPSSSVAYVEFETEYGKEKAIAKHSIHILQQQLLIFRIDVPRTTVVRISNLNGQHQRNIYRICNSFGQVKKIANRNMDTLDVHFKLAEWPNMLNILNSLNGMEVEGHRWVALPAPVFPPAVLQALWNEPDERRHVEATMRSLLQKIEESADMLELTNLIAKHYRDKF